ncbi:MAG: tRNA dihydrouridine synthase DusB [Lachnospiraceae bacterium]|nr:tRNA dihydrouridine synthase DusB [Lachnospiraceae bacterium]
MIEIGNVKIKHPWMLAPMAGVCDLPFRVLCAECGASLLCTEMISAKAIFYKNKNTEELMQIDEREKPVSLQLFGREAGLMADMAKQIEERPFDILDINMGCPVPKVVNNGEGSALMKEPKLVGEIISAIAQAIQKPVTVKIRAGFDETHKNAPEIAHIAQESGVAAVVVHGRTREQYYSGKADWEIIRLVKESVTIPVIGNGDVCDFDSGMRMMEETGCDGVMIGRAARGNPWIFGECVARMNGETYTKPTYEEIKTMILRHAEMLCEHKGEYIGMREMRKHASWYTQGLKGASKLRGKLNEIEHFDELKFLLDSYLPLDI